MLKNIFLNTSKHLKTYSASYNGFQMNRRFESSHNAHTDSDIKEIIKKLQNYKGKVYPAHTFLKIDVRWGDQDAMNHVNNIKYFQFLEQVRVNWFFHSAKLPLSAVEAIMTMLKIHLILAFKE